LCLSGKPGEEGKMKPSLLQRLFSRNKRLEYVRVQQSELVERLKKFLLLAVDLAVFQGEKRNFEN
jgi:hypothetical protein